MKRFIAIAVLAAVLAALLASTALAAGPVGGRWAQQGDTPSTGACPMGGPGAMGAAGAGMMGRPAWAGQPDEIETLLGMSDTEIQAQRQAGKSLAEIAASKDIREKELIDTILAAKTTGLQQAVKDGKLTQAQADLMVQNMQTMVKTMVERTTTGPMGGRGQGMHGGGMNGSGMRGQGMRGGFTF